MDIGDWRTQLQNESRQRIVNKIMDTWKRYLPFTGQEALQELKKIAIGLEEKIYTAATSQSDYLRKISLKMMTMESKSQYTMANSVPSNSAGNSKGGGVDRCPGLCAQVRDGLFKNKDLEKDLLSSAVSEIKLAVGVVFESRIIVFARTWMLCNSCNSLSTCRYSPRLLASRGGYFSTPKVFKEAGTSCILQKGEGVVGKAAKSSQNLVYCENVAKFSTIEYPLAHFAHICNLSACFALCLRSSYTGDQVYILEFFLHPDRVRGMDLRTMLVPILDQMKRDFRTFKVAFGREELGDRLPVLVTNANSPDKLETLIGQETSMEDTLMEDVPVASASTVQSGFHVTIKAKYGEDRFIIFQLPPSSGIHELYHQLSQRLGLLDGSYDLKYLDEENDLIELTCDEDLQLYISNSVIDEMSTLMVLVVPK